MSKSIAVIPVRLASTRLPNKPLVDIKGHPMIWHVYHRCLQAKKIAEVHVATDTPEIAEMVESWGGKAWMTDESCQSGTERIVSIVDKLDADIIINVQGDEPLLEPQVIDEMVDAFESTEPMPDIVTPACKIKPEDIFNPNVVKMVVRHDGYAMYFSRNPIPYVRDAENNEQWQQKVEFLGHLGMYGYRRHVLESYAQIPESPLENIERLEQLRFLQAGFGIYTYPTEHSHISVDTPEDLARVRAIFEQQRS
ncbi:3-deoxy-manno-octulosonate cytidylyltransferase [Candidatus Albibeggiatoa sp. nov. NOAA]|uniref:3-deoxy-manno-octulosonate cytidylyltransferase n=1 Tax=Candidatus Albibeggiatoa sp. nov. NOAA TaxID=3162724 RepID=UPI0032FA3835|nr:3-deoxy-manno-octulosonate cytidylyltransferase [Thiotrichaceae bacterium]